MIDKFQKLFGPNPPRSTAEHAQDAGYDESREADAYRRQLVRIRNKRRVLGLLILVMGIAVVAPSFLEPNDYYANRGAKLEIPALQDGAPARVVSLAPEKARPLPDPPVVPKAPSTAASLSAANKVNGSARPAQAQGAEPAASERPAAGQRQQPAAAAQKPAQEPAQKPAAGAAGKSSDKGTGKAAGQAPQKAAEANEPLRAVANGRYFIQVIATSNQNSAQRQAQKLRALGLPAYTEIVHRRGTDLWRVRVGRFASELDARRAMDILALNAIDNGGVNEERESPSK